MSRPARPSVTFDRAVGYYDATRGLTPEAAARLNNVLLDALGDRDPVLEIGVGTGRIAVPLRAGGAAIVGIDLSEPMLREMTAKSPLVPAAQADCTRLPFPDATFGAVVASHVFHLVPEWRAAVVECLRVLRPDGCLLWARGGFDGHVEDAAAVFAAAARIDRTPAGLDHVQGLDAYLRSRGWAGAWLEPVVDDRLLSLGELIDLYEAGVYGWTWPASEEERSAGGVAARAWAAEQPGGLDEPQMVARPVRFRRYTPLP